jgi:anti-sigma factor RsiW
VKDECRDVTAFLDEYLERSLAADSVRVFEEHIAECADCAHFLASYRATRALAGEALRGGPAAASSAPAPMALPVPERLIEAILAARRRER